MNQEIKAYTTRVKEKLVAVASTETPDRTGDSIIAAGWQLKHFKENPVIPFAHKYNEPPVGIAKNIRIEGKNLIFEPVFHEFTQLAREVKAMYEADTPIMRAFSVGFIPLEYDKKKKSTIIKQELLEISAVPVPANQEALTIKSKSYTDEEEVKIKRWIKRELALKKIMRKALQRIAKDLGSTPCDPV